MILQPFFHCCWIDYDILSCTCTCSVLISVLCFFSGQSSGAEENRLLPFVSVEDITHTKKLKKQKKINYSWFFFQMITNGAILVGVNVHCWNAGTWMLFYFNTICSDLPYIIAKQYVTINFKLLNLRLALGMNRMMLLIKTGVGLERCRSKQDLLYSLFFLWNTWNTSVLTHAWIQEIFQKRGSEG